VVLLPYRENSPFIPDAETTSYRRRLHNDDYEVCVAVDIGTTYSSYAYSFKGKEKEVSVCDNWGSNVGVANTKAPTVLLVDDAGSLVAFGYEALETHHDLGPQEAAKHFLHEKFKMLLKESESNVRPTSSSTNCKQSVLILLIATQPQSHSGFRRRRGAPSDGSLLNDDGVLQESFQ
jgi:hypothetical protein